MWLNADAELTESRGSWSAEALIERKQDGFVLTFTQPKEGNSFRIRPRRSLWAANNYFPVIAIREEENRAD
jgi:hypothetical protein